MPALIEWMVHHPSDWTPRQARSYQAHMLRLTTQALVPTVQALGVPNTAAILQSVIVHMVQCNPLAARDVCVQLANTFEIVEGLDPLVGAVKQ